jgi:hypothetical protein
MTEMRAIEFNDIARHSAWPPRLLNPDQQVRHKTDAEVLREYNRDKWGELLEFVRATPGVTLEMIEDHHVDPTDLAPYYEDGRFYLATEHQALDRHLDFYARTLQPHLAGASCLVELGAGFGSKILRLARRPEFAGLPLVAGEYTANGQAVIDAVAKASGVSMQVGYCDFRHLEFDDLQLPENAVIFTSYSVHYVPELSDRFVPALLALRPKAIVNFEPVYEYYPSDSIHGLMCRRYTELNDYTRNLGTLIDAAVVRGEVRATISRNVLGSNPFLPISAIEWTSVR